MFVEVPRKCYLDFKLHCSVFAQISLSLHLLCLHATQSRSQLRRVLLLAVSLNLFKGLGACSSSERNFIQSTLTRGNDRFVIAYVGKEPQKRFRDGLTSCLSLLTNRTGSRGDLAASGGSGFKKGDSNAYRNIL